MIVVEMPRWLNKSCARARWGERRRRRPSQAGPKAKTKLFFMKASLARSDACRTCFMRRNGRAAADTGARSEGRNDRARRQPPPEDSITFDEGVLVSARIALFALRILPRIPGLTDHIRISRGRHARFGSRQSGGTAMAVLFAAAHSPPARFAPKTRAKSVAQYPLCSPPPR